MKSEEKYLEKMTDEQKKEFYVTKISRLSSDEYKLLAGDFVSGGIAVISAVCEELFPDWRSMGLVSISIFLYCLSATILNRIEQKITSDELAELNQIEDKSEGRTI